MNEDSSEQLGEKPDERIEYTEESVVKRTQKGVIDPPKRKTLFERLMSNKLIVGSVTVFAGTLLSMIYAQNVPAKELGEVDQPIRRAEKSIESSHRTTDQLEEATHDLQFELKKSEQERDAK